MGRQLKIRWSNLAGKLQLPCAPKCGKTHEKQHVLPNYWLFFFSRRDSKMMEKYESSYCCYSVFFLVPVTHVLKTHSWFQNLKFLLARATIPSSTGFTPNICSSIIAWLLTRSLAPRCGGDVSRERTCGPWNKSLNGLYIFPTKYVIPKSFKSNHWPNSILFAGTKKSWR